MAWHDQLKQRDHPDVQAYIEDLDGWHRGLIEEVRALVKRDPDVVECLAWGVPFWFRKGPLCYASAANKHVTLGFARGLEIGDGLVGTGRSPIAKCVVEEGASLPDGFAGWLRRAIELDTVGE